MTVEEIEEIISLEIFADAKDDEDIHMACYIFMMQALDFPFKAIATIKKRNSTSEERTVEVVEDATDGDRFKGQAYYAHVDYEGVLMKVEMSDLKPINASEETMKAITVWKYWKEKGYY